MRFAILGVVCYFGIALCATLLVSEEDLTKKDRYRQQCEATPYRSLFAISTDNVLTCYIGAGNCLTLPFQSLSNWMWNRQQRTISEQELQLLKKHGLDKEDGNVCVFDANMDSPIKTTTSTTTMATTTTEKKTICPQDYKQFQGKCYNYVCTSNSINWHDASHRCKKVPGGMLATIPNAETNSFVKSIYPIYPIRQITFAAFGLICPRIKFYGDKSSCYWLDGTPFAYDAFFENGPYSDMGGIYCNFNLPLGWTSCYPGDALHFNDYICQAPPIN